MQVADCLVAWLLDCLIAWLLGCLVALAEESGYMK